jgi:hypothetical protein
MMKVEYLKLKIELERDGDLVFLKKVRRIEQL